MTGENVVLSGMRSTGKLHLGNYFGAVRNWVELQDRYDCYYFVADWHALTTDYADPSKIADNTLEVVADYLASGLDPEKSVIFVQSLVPEHAELHLLLSMITPLGWLERVPTYKEQVRELENRDLATFGFLGYPVLQTADIIIYRADFVPVGEDQRSHLELSREITRRFNGYYGPVFPELTKQPSYIVASDAFGLACAQRWEDVPLQQVCRLPPRLVHLLGVLVLVLLGKLSKGDALAGLHLVDLRISAGGDASANFACCVAGFLEVDRPVAIEMVPAQLTAGSVGAFERLVAGRLGDQAEAALLGVPVERFPIWRPQVPDEPVGKLPAVRFAPLDRRHGCAPGLSLD